MKYIGLNQSRIKVLWNWALVVAICCQLSYKVDLKWHLWKQTLESYIY